MAALSKLRGSVLSLLDELNNSPDSSVKVVQDLNVKIPSGSKRPINIYQFQSATISSQTIAYVVGVLKQIDDLSEQVAYLTFDALFDEVVNSGMTWREFLDFVKRGLIRAFLRRNYSVTTTAARLGVQRTYLSRLISQFKIR